MDRTYNCRRVHQHRFNNKIPIVGLFEDQTRYYVNMPIIRIVTNHAFIIEPKNMVEKLAQLSLDEIIEFRNLKVQLKWHWHRGVII
jgi:hypothetical protein